MINRLINWMIFIKKNNEISRKAHQIFFEGLYSQKNETLKKIKIKNKENKISHGRGNSLMKKVGGWVDLDSPYPLKPLPNGWENTERIASLNSYS